MEDASTPQPHDSSEGPEMRRLLEPLELQRIIEAAIPDSQVLVTDLTGTRDHYRVEVVSPVFEGKPLVQQHQIVYRAVGDHMTNAVHALQIRTAAKIPENNLP